MGENLIAGNVVYWIQFIQSRETPVFIGTWANVLHALKHFHIKNPRHLSRKHIIKIP